MRLTHFVASVLNPEKRDSMMICPQVVRPPAAQFWYFKIFMLHLTFDSAQFITFAHQNAMKA